MEAVSKHIIQSDKSYVYFGDDQSEVYVTQSVKKEYDEIWLYICPFIE